MGEPRSIAVASVLTARVDAMCRRAGDLAPPRVVEGATAAAKSGRAARSAGPAAPIGTSFCWPRPRRSCCQRRPPGVAACPGARCGEVARARGQGRCRQCGSSSARPRRRRGRPERAVRDAAHASRPITHRVSFCASGRTRHPGPRPFPCRTAMIKVADQVTGARRYRFVPSGPALLPAKITQSDSQYAALICRVFARRSAEIHRIGQPVPTWRRKSFTRRPRAETSMSGLRLVT